MFFRKTPGRRKIRFHSYEEIVTEVECLVPAHQALGNWSLAQICNHLADTQEYSVGSGGSEIRTGRLFQATVGRVAMRALLWFGFLPAGAGNLSPRPAAEPEEAVGRLKAAMRLVALEPMTIDHPIFGRMTPKQWRQFHLRHAAHHLSFVVPVPP